MQRQRQRQDKADAGGPTSLMLCRGMGPPGLKLIPCTLIHTTHRCPIIHMLRPAAAARAAVCCLLFLLPGLLPAQQPSGSPPGTTLPPRAMPPDTTPLLYSYPQSPERSQILADTLPDARFRQYNPTRRQPVDWGNLGNLGSATRPLYFESPLRRGFDLGYHAYDLYRLEANDLRFYHNTRTFSEVYFSQGRTQFDGMVNARFGRTFGGGSNLSVDYRSINNKGQYLYQRDKHNTLGIGLWVPLGQRYDGFLIFCNNINRQQENGGIVSDTVFGGSDLTGPTAAEIRLPDQHALTRDADQTLQLTQHLTFTGAGREQAGKRVLRATHTFAWTRERFKFSDSPLNKDRAFFYPVFLTDLRGLRHYVNLHRIDNTLWLSTFKVKQKGRPSDVLSAGLRYSHFRLQQEPRADSTFSNLFAAGQITLTPSERFAFSAQGDLGLLNNFLEYQLQGSLTLGLGRFGQLRGQLLSQRHPPSLLQQRLYVSSKAVWVNDFQKPVEHSLSATYGLPWAGIELTARTHLVHNYLYFDQAGLPRQIGTPLQVAQVLATANFRFGPIRSDNTVALQRNNRTDLLRLPAWITRNSLYYSGRLFKKRLFLESGADFRTNAVFTPDTYQPLTNQFYLQDSLKQSLYPSIDLFASFKVQSFRFFFRYENIANWWDKTTVWYQTARYPQPFGSVRFGIAWRFMDDNVETTTTPTSPGTSPDSPSSRPPTGSRGRK